MPVKNKNEMSDIKEYLSPDFIYIPYIEGYNLKVTSIDYLYKNSPIMEKDGLVFYSPISGNIIAVENMMNASKEIVKCIKIANDFKEKEQKKQAIKRSIENYTKKEIIDILKKYGAVEQNQKNVFLYKLFQIKENIDTLIVSAFDKEIGIPTEKYSLKNNMENILNTIDILVEVFKINNCYLIFNSDDIDNISTYTKLSRTYPKIRSKILANKYSNGLKHTLIKECCGIKADMNEILHMTTSSILSINDILRKNTPISTKIITIFKDDEEKIIPINVKIGSKVLPIIEKHFNIIEENDLVYYGNGMINGEIIDINKLIVTPELSGIYITKSKNVSVNKCINCGKCSDVCPLKINPKHIMENANDKEIQKEAKAYLCIDCGLCTNICPSHINLKEYLKNAKR